MNLMIMNFVNEFLYYYNMMPYIVQS